MVRLLRRPDINKPWLFARCREIETARDGYLDLWAREHGKDLADDTPILTFNRGWVNHGEIIVGDSVYDDEGHPRPVLGLSERYTESQCYRVEFSDGATIVAGAGHLWRVRRKHKLRVGDWRIGHREVMWDDEIVQTAHLPKRADVGALQQPLAGNPQQLPIDPYVLGAWLGDGTKGGSAITAGLADADEMQALLAARGIPVSRCVHSNAVTLRIGSGQKYKRGSSDFKSAARALGILNQKRIPAIYLRASAHQRMMLLRGLMDTDGTCNTRGTATLVSSIPALARDFYELAASLALRPRLREYKHNVGPYAGSAFTQINFQAHSDRAPFTMARKVARCISPSAHRNCRDVVSVTPIESVPTRCIEVEGGIYLAGRELVPTHNSSLISFGLTVQDILRDQEITVGIFSHTRPIAKAFLGQIKREFETNEYLKWLYSDVLYDNPEKQSPKWSEDGGLIVKRRGNPKEATVEAHGLVDGQPTSRHFRLRVYDDVVTLASVGTAEQIEKTTKAWELSLNLGVQENQGGAARYIGTRYQLGDTYAEMMKRGAVKQRIHPATHNGRLDGKPVLFSEAEWERRKRDTSRQTLAAQMLQNPMADEAATFRPEWLRAYEVRPRTLNVYIMADPSRGRSADSDNTAIAVVGLSSTGAKFLLDGACHRMTLSQRWVMLRGMYQKWSKTAGVQHISVGYERYGAQSDDEYFQEQMLLDERKKLPNAHFVIRELNWTRDGTQSKRERVERLEPDFRNSRFYLPLPVTRNSQPMTWHVDTDTESKSFGEVSYKPVGGPTRNQMAAIEGGSADLLAKAIRQRDQDGSVYDVTTHFISEYQEFPFGALKDLVDATSRIYDMEAVPPMLMSKADSEPQQFWDR